MNNFSSHIISSAEETLLSIALNSSTPSKSLDYKSHKLEKPLVSDH